MKRSPRPSRLRLTVFSVVLIGTTRGLLALGGLLPSPPLDTRIVSYVTRTDPLLATFAILRLVALALCWYLVLTTALGVLARLTRIPSLIAAVDVVTLPSVRTLLRTVMSASLATSIGLGGATTMTVLATAPPVAAVAAPLPSSTTPSADDGPKVTTAPSSDQPMTATTNVPTMRVLDEPSTSRSAAVTAPVMRVVDEPAPPPTTAVPAPPTTAATAPTATPDAGRAAAAPTLSTPTPALPSAPTMHTDDARPITPAATPAAPASDPTTMAPPPATSWTIEPGDHLWHVAQATLRSARGRSPSDAETATYLQRVIEANRHVLVVPSNPDLVFPGQVFTLPSL